MKYSKSKEFILQIEIFYFGFMHIIQKLES